MKYTGSILKVTGLDRFFMKSHISNFQVLSVLLIFLLCHFVVYRMSKSGVRHDLPMNKASHAPSFLKTFSFKIQPNTLIVVFLMVTTLLYAIHFSAPSYTLRDTSRKLGEIFYNNTLVIGGVADSLCLENKAKTSHIWESPEGKILNESIIKNNQADYLLSIKKVGDILIPEIELSSRLKLLPIETFILCPTRNGKDYKVEVEFFKIRKSR